MSKKILIIDAVLVALLALGVVRFQREWKAFGPAHDLALIQPKEQSFPPLLASVAPGAPGADWTDIPKSNPFSFDRSDVDIVVAPPPEAPPKPLGPKPVFFGSVILGKDDKFAMVAPGPSGRNYKEMKIGSVVDGWTIVEIERKAMVIQSGGVRETVIMNDPSVQVPRDVVRTAGGVAPGVIQSGQPTVPTAGSSTAASQTSTVTGQAQAPRPAATPETFNALDLFGGPKR